MNAPGRGLLIVSGVMLVIVGIVGLGAWGVMQPSPPPAMELASPFIFGLSWRVVYTLMFLFSGFCVGIALDGLIHCNAPNKAGALKIRGFVVLVLEILSIILFIRHIDFSVGYLIIPGIIIMYIVGAVKNENAWMRDLASG